MHTFITQYYIYKDIFNLYIYIRTMSKLSDVWVYSVYLERLGGLLSFTKVSLFGVLSSGV